jgi:hypothetical protein
MKTSVTGPVKRPGFHVPPPTKITSVRAIPALYESTFTG